MTKPKEKPFRMTGSITRRSILTRAGAFGAVSLAAPFVATPARAAGTVNVLAFGGYEEPGMLDAFTESTGIAVNLKIHDGSDEEMIALMQSSEPGTFDVITPTSAYIPKAIEDGILAELDPDSFPLDDYFKLIAEWPPVWKDGKLYAIVNRFGYYGITYNHDKFSEADVSSYDILFDPAVKGRVALFDWFLPNMGCMSKYNGNPLPYDLDTAAFGALTDTLTRLRPQVGLVGNTSQVIQAMAGGSYDLAIAGEWVQAGMFDDGLPFKALVPEQGGVTWDQAVCVSATTPNKDNAAKFVQHVTGPDFQAKLAVAKTYYSMVPNKNAALKLPNDKRALLNLSDIDKFDEVFMANLSPRKDPANRGDWLNAWEAFKNT
ncbi:PotD/PotF family extracellular solute-binding protein [Roseobacter sp.]|uniref:ABC transporter substrate-binding protein n=1 Tax=Roseobacter sp. TaxID=1907202 RepID=UPI0038596D35